MSNGTTYNWTDLQEAEAKALKKGEFQGMVMQALQDLGQRVDRIEGQNDQRALVQMLISGLVGGLAGIFGGKVRI